MLNTDAFDLGPRIQVIGVGDKGCETVTALVDTLPSEVALVCAHAQPAALHAHAASSPLQLLLADAAFIPQRIRAALAGTHMLFLTACLDDRQHHATMALMAQTAKSMGILTIACTEASTQPAHASTAPWLHHVDAHLVTHTHNVCNTLHSAVYETAALLSEYGQVNLDFEDVRTILGIPGKAVVGSAQAQGANRAQAAAERALEGMDLSSAQGLLVLVSAAKGSLRLSESRQALQAISTHHPQEAHIIYGAAYDDALDDRIRVTVFASGLSQPQYCMGAESGSGHP